MRKFFKWTGIVIGCLLLLIVIITALLQFRTYEAPYPNIAASTDSMVIQKGKYLALGQAHCADCHAPVDKFDLVQAGKEVPLSGGRVFKIPPGDFF